MSAPKGAATSTVALARRWDKGYDPHDRLRDVVVRLLGMQPLKSQN